LKVSQLLKGAHFILAKGFFTLNLLPGQKSCFFLVFLHHYSSLSTETFQPLEACLLCALLDYLLPEAYLNNGATLFVA